MKKIWEVFVGLFAAVLIFSPHLGILFACSMLISFLLGVWPFHITLWSAYFATAWKIYVALSALTFVVVITFFYQNCCVGLSSFSRHIWHRSKMEMALNEILGSLLWPFCWYGLNRAFSNWGLPWGQIILNALAYWFLDRWHGVSLETIDLTTGETKSYRIKN